MAVELAKEAYAAGIPAVIVFGLPEYKDEQGSSAWDATSPVQEAIRQLKRALPELVVISDVCLCQYTSHGHCGLLKGEKGIHRLIRISPFDSSGRRHTSFASVDVIPDVGNDIELDIKESDIRVDIFRSSGPGGQSVNTTSSAVRVTHIPTGVTAQCQIEKSQHHNKDTAMRVLRARLYNMELQKRDAERQAEYAGKDAIAFGSQIRTYTLQPYRLVKDHRTNSEAGDVEAVLNGQIDQFQHDYLMHRHEQQR